MSHGMFEELESSDGSIREASKQSQQKLAAAIYDVKEKYGEFLNGATALDEFHDRVALVKSDLMKTVDAAGVMPVTGTMRRITKALKDEWRQRTARDVASDEESRANYEKIKPKPGDILGGGGGRAGYHPDESYIRGEEVHTRQAGRYDALQRIVNNHQAEDIDGQLVDAQTANLLLTLHGKGNDRTKAAIETAPLQKVVDTAWKLTSSRHQADKTGPAMHVDNTFSPSHGDLVPKGDFKGYLKSVSQGAEEKISDRFVDTETPTQEHTGDPAKTDFTKDSSVALQVFSDWCQSEGLRTASIDAFDKYAENLSDEQYFKLASEIQRTAFDIGGLAGGIGGIASGIGGLAGGGLGSLISGVGDVAQQGVGMIENLAGGMGGGAAPAAPGGAPGPTNDLAGAGAGSGGVKASSRTAGGVNFPEGDQHTWYDETGLEHGRGDRTEELEANGWKKDQQGRWFNPQDKEGPWRRKGSRRTAQGGGKTDYLQKADEALTNVLNQKAEEFQEGIAALQQALQIIQQNEAQQQMMNPMGVQPPAGTVNVLPDQAAAGGVMPAGDPNAAAGGGMPPGGGDPAAGGQPPMDPSQMMMQGSRRQADEHSGTVTVGDRLDHPENGRGTIVAIGGKSWGGKPDTEEPVHGPYDLRVTHDNGTHAHYHVWDSSLKHHVEPRESFFGPRQGSIHKLDDPGACKDGEDSDVKGQSAKKITDDWHSRDKNQRWVAKGGKRQGGAAPFVNRRQGK